MFRSYALACLFSLFLFNYLGATTVPIDQELLKTSKKPAEVDGSLAAWFKQNADKENALELESKKFQKYLKYRDNTEAAFLRLRYAMASGKGEAKALKLAVKELDNLKNLEMAKVEAHPITPYLLEELLQSRDLSNAHAQKASRYMEQFGGRSCPRKDFLLRELTDSFSGKALKDEELHRLLDQIYQFKSRKFISEALETFLDNLPQEKQDILRDKLASRVSSYPKLIEDNQWLLDDDSKSSEPFLSFEKSIKNAKRRRCRTAKMNLIAAVKIADDRGDHFQKADEVANRVANCFKRRGRRARFNFWRQIEKPLEKRFGFKGQELARRKIALIHWHKDEFVESKAIFTDILKQARDSKAVSIEANALYTMARIFENEGEIEKSIEYYTEFSRKFPDSEEYLKAKMALVLLSSVSGEIKESLKNAEDIVNSQALLALDDRSITASSFALFWAGKLHLSLGNKDLAREMWRRSASEYYSTFYGALGHYMLEKLEGKSLSLAPQRSGKFNPKKLYEGFDYPDQRILHRIETLLSLGLKEEASCEIAELETKPGENDKVLIKSLMQNASGEWLASIKNFDSLKRSYRSSLPIGFERILFPRSFGALVKNYSGRLGLDPDFVFAIIRQESVFNPKARSGAGARGLMQLMPATARVEARHLSRSYLNSKGRRKIRRSVRKRSNLFDAEINLTLGVHHVHRLLKKYGNPVLVLTSYNANPSATRRWVNNLPTKDYLAFIERIPYAETKTYVKLVLRNYFYYKRWYRGPSQRMPHLDYLAENQIVVAQNLQKKLAN